MTEISLKALLAPSFYEIHRDIKEYLHTHYWEKGGRGSTKSSFVAIEIPYGMLKDPKANAICFRKYAVSLERSVYNQLKWGIEKLGLSSYWRAMKSPLRLEYIPTGQEIIFSGMDDPQKLKSLKPSNGGYFKYSWFEECDEFDGMEEIRNVEQTILRGGDKFVSFKTFNPPEDTAHWINTEVQQERPDRCVHHSTYLDVPADWLGKQFFIEAEHLKKTNEKAYRHEYLGEAVGTGLKIFPNVVLRKITAAEKAKFYNINEGIDWGYAVDPFVWIQDSFERKYRRLYIFNEIYQAGLSNYDAIEQVKKKHNPSTEIIADREEPKSIDEFEDAGLPIRKASQPPGSVSFGIKKLRGLEQIIIDPERCPNAAREFSSYAHEKNPDGTVKSKYPDKNNHTIDAVRYSLEDEFDY